MSVLLDVYSDCVKKQLFFLKKQLKEAQTVEEIEKIKKQIVKIISDEEKMIGNKEENPKKEVIKMNDLMIGGKNE